MNPEIKRAFLVAVVLGLVACGIVLGLDRSGLLARPQQAIANFVSLPAASGAGSAGMGQYLVAFLLAASVAFLGLVMTRRQWLGLVVAVLLLELAAAAWVFSLYQVRFQPLPALIATLLGFVLPIGYLGLMELGRKRQDEEPAPLEDRPPEPVSVPAPVRAKRPEVAPSSPAGARACEVTAVVCDIANKHDLADECEPAVFVEIVEKFLTQATEAFRKAGAYIEAAGGEGVVAIFGYPEDDQQHAEKAARKAMELTKAFLDANKSGKSEFPVSVGVNAGVSTGTMIMAPVRNNGQRILLATGEPVELARRLCIANRFYGSRVLLGPRTFELACKILVARPIDFLSGIEARERHEIYEPIALALDATRDQITRRDAFWNGVVLYREKRWAEAYSKFQDARDPEGREDRPLQLYLRRIEPLALRLTNAPLEE